MALRFYADGPGRRAAQVVADVGCLLWAWLWVAVGLAVHDAVAALAAPAREVEQGATGLADGLRSAGDVVDGVPVVGDELVAPFDSAASAAGEVAAGAAAQATAVERLAVLLAVLVVLLPVALVLVVWAPARIRFARRAGATARLLHEGADLDLFALRALAGRPVHRLARIAADPMAAYRSGDPAALRALAALELRASGVRPPPALSPPPTPGPPPAPDPSRQPPAG